MNERIDELMLEASTTGKRQVWFTRAEVEHVAELIVKECATVQHKRFCEHGDVSWDILMEHFGVEE